MSDVDQKPLTAIEQFRVLALTCPKCGALAIPHARALELLAEIDVLRRGQLAAEAFRAEVVADASSRAAKVLEDGRGRAEAILSKAEDVRRQALELVKGQWRHLRVCALILLGSALVQFGVILWPEL